MNWKLLKSGFIAVVVIIFLVGFMVELANLIGLIERLVLWSLFIPLSALILTLIGTYITYLNFKHLTTPNIYLDTKTQTIHLTPQNYLIVAVGLARRGDALDRSIASSCIEEDDEPKDRRGIIRYIELGEQNLAYLFMEAISEIGVKNAANLANVISLWEKWADEGLKIMYCNYYSKYFNSSPRKFFDLLMEYKPISTE